MKNLALLTALFLMGSVSKSQNLCFDPASDNRYACGGTPNGIAAGDFNEDGFQDVAVANYLSDQVGIFLGEGNGSFLPVALIPSYGNNPEDIGVADYNDDGHDDIVCFHRGSVSTIVTIHGNGDGTFDSGLAFPLGMPGSVPRTLRSADLNGDAVEDLIVNNYSDGEVWILVAEETGFVQVQTIQVMDEPEYIATGDIDADGDIDFVVGAVNDMTALPFRNNGTASFSQANALSLPSSSPVMEAAIGDVDGDGIGDISLAAEAQAYIYISGGDGTFASALTEFMGSYATEAQCFDADQDGQDDMIWTAASSGFVGVLETDGTDFEAYQRYSVNGDPTDFVLGDYNEDGVMDLVSCNYGDESITFMQGHGDGRFGPLYLIAQGSPNDLAIADFNEDGYSDIATSSFFPGSISIIPSLGDGTFDETIVIPTLYALADIATDDLNADGDPDIVLSLPGYGINVYIGESGFGFADPVGYPAGSGAGGERDIVIADFNGDGYPDVAGSYANDDAMSILFNNGNGTFGTEVSYGVGDIPSGIMAADLNNDDLPEIVVACDLSNNLYLFENLGAGVMNSPQIIDVGSSPRSIVSGDFDEDGLVDLISSDNNSVQLSVVLQGAGGFPDAPSSVILLTGDTSPGNLVSGDFTGDGHLDVAVIHGLDDSVLLIAGNGDGSFDSPLVFDVDNGSTGITTGDFNGDDALDIATANTTAGNVSVILNNSLFIEASGNTVLCPGDEVTLSVSGDPGSSYLWSNGSTSPSIVVSEEGVYSCQVTNQSGSCTLLTPSVDVQVLTDVSAGFAQGFNEDVCLDADSYQLVGGSPQGGQYGGPGVENGIFNPAAAGVGIHEITYTYTDPGGCGTSSASDEVVVFALPAVSLDFSYADEPQPLCSNYGPYPFNGGSPSGGVYEVEGASGDVWVTDNLEDGTYTITYVYTDDNSCSAQAIQQVNVQLCAGVSETEQQVTVFPTITDGWVRVSGQGEFELRVFDSTGKLVLIRQIIHQEVIDLSAMNAGAYYFLTANGSYKVIRK